MFKRKGKKEVDFSFVQLSQLPRIQMVKAKYYRPTVVVNGVDCGMST